MIPHCNFVPKPSRRQGFWIGSRHVGAWRLPGEVSHLWSCTTLGDGLKHVDAEVALVAGTCESDDEAELLAQLKEL